jgi:hypothetical protein
MKMAKNLDEIQEENMDAAIKSFGAMSKAFQAIAVSSRIIPRDHSRTTRRLQRSS